MARTDVPGGGYLVATRHEPIDTRLALTVYAAVTGLGGLALAVWGQIWLGSHPAELPWGRAVVLRMSGSVMMASAVLAFGLRIH